MPIRPIDLQVIVPKAQTNPSAREHMVNKEAMQLQQSQMETKKVSTEKDKKVNQLAHKDGSKVEEKKNFEKDKKKNAKASSKQSDKEEDEKTEKKPEAKGWNFHRFDMKV